MFEYIIFGIVDNGIMLLGAITGLSVERYLPKYFQNGIGTLFGAGIANAVSDWSGGAVTGSWDLAFGTLIGCLIALLFVPVYKIYKDLHP